MLAPIYGGRFTGIAVANIGVVPGISLQKLGWVNFDAEISADGSTLWFDDGQYSSSGVLRAATIVTASRHDGSFVRDVRSAALLARVNASGLNYARDMSVNGLDLIFTHVDRMTPGSIPAIYRATRRDTASAFGDPELVSAATGFVEAPCLSADGHLLYFHKQVDGRFGIYSMRR